MSWINILLLVRNYCGESVRNHNDTMRAGLGLCLFVLPFARAMRTTDAAAYNQYASLAVDLTGAHLTDDGNWSGALIKNKDILSHISQ